MACSAFTVRQAETTGFEDGGVQLRRVGSVRRSPVFCTTLLRTHKYNSRFVTVSESAAKNVPFSKNQTTTTGESRIPCHILRASLLRRTRGRRGRRLRWVTYATAIRLVKQGKNDQFNAIFDFPYGGLYPTKIPAGRLEIVLAATESLKEFDLGLASAEGWVRLNHGSPAGVFFQSQDADDLFAGNRNNFRKNATFRLQLTSPFLVGQGVSSTIQPW